MQPIAFTHPVLSLVLGGLSGVWVLGELAIRIRSWANSAGSGTRPERGSLVVLLVALVVGFVGAGLVVRTAPATAVHGLPVFVAGALVMLAGIALRWWAVIVLGRSFTIEVRVRDAQQVVDRGPYAVVRHPSYTGLGLVFVGFGLMLGNWLALVVVVVIPMAGLIARIRVEERMLADGIGDPYRRYLARVRYRLVPYLW